ncbi:MAG: hypothetical protein AB1512_07945 [Thermodesulfobacteriota bacterium]
MKARGYIVWSTRREIDLEDPVQRREYIQEVLTHGLASDVSELDWDEIKEILPQLKLPERVLRLWRFYFGEAER